MSKQSQNHLAVLIKGRGYNASNLVGILPYCRITIQKKLNEPDTFSLKDLSRLISKRILTSDEVASAIIEQSQKTR